MGRHSTLPFSFATIVVLAVCLSLFWGCAPHSKIISHDWSKGIAPVVPDSLRAKVRIVVHRPNGARDELSGVLFSVPGQKHRLELNGPLGISLGSLLWKDSSWILLLHQEELWLQGRGERVGVAGTPLDNIPIHDVAGFFAGQLLPPGFQNAVSFNTRTQTVLEWTMPAERYGMRRVRAVLDKESGAVQQVVYPDPDPNVDERWLFTTYTNFGSATLPQTATLLRAGKQVLQMELKEVRQDAKWGAAVWKLPIPPDYRPLLPTDGSAR